MKIKNILTDFKTYLTALATAGTLATMDAEAQQNYVIAKNSANISDFVNVLRNKNYVTLDSTINLSNRDTLKADFGKGVMEPVRMIYFRDQGNSTNKFDANDKFFLSNSNPPTDLAGIVEINGFTQEGIQYIENNRLQTETTTHPTNGQATRQANSLRQVEQTRKLTNMRQIQPGQKYIVESGDTWGLLGLAWKMPWKSLAESHNVTDNVGGYPRLTVGQEITNPGSLDYQLKNATWSNGNPWNLAVLSGEGPYQLNLPKVTRALISNANIDDVIPILEAQGVNSDTLTAILEGANRNPANRAEFYPMFLDGELSKDDLTTLRSNQQGSSVYGFNLNMFSGLVVINSLTEATQDTIPVIVDSIATVATVEETSQKDYVNVPITLGAGLNYQNGPGINLLFLAGVNPKAGLSVNIGTSSSKSGLISDATAFGNDVYQGQVQTSTKGTNVGVYGLLAKEIHQNLDAYGGIGFVNARKTETEKGFERHFKDGRLIQENSIDDLIINENKFYPSFKGGVLFKSPSNKLGGYIDLNATFRKGLKDALGVGAGITFYPGAK